MACDQSILIRNPAGMLIAVLALLIYHPLNASGEFRFDSTSRPSRGVTVRKGVGDRDKTQNETTRQLSALIGKFRNALDNKRLVYPATACATYFYQEMTKLSSGNSLDEYKLELVNDLFRAAFDALGHDLRGQRLYQKHPVDATVALDNRISSKMNNSFPISQSGRGYNLNYYKDAALCLESYISLKKRGIEPAVYATKAYLDGRQLTIQYQETEDPKWITLAIKQLKIAVSKYSTEACLWQALAMAYLEDPKSDYDKVAQAANRARERAPGWSFPLVTLGQCALEQDRAAEGEALFQKANDLNPLDVAPYLNLGKMKRSTTDHSRSLTFFRKAYAIDSLSTLTIFNLGQELYFARMYDSCAWYMSRVIRLDSLFQEAYFYYAYSLSVRGEKKEALTQYKKVIRFNPGAYNVYNNMGDIVNDLGQKEESLSYFSKAVQAKPDYVLAYYNRAVVLTNLSRTEEAIKDYEKVIQLDPDRPDAYSNLGSILKDRHREKEAGNYFSEAARRYREKLDSHPDDAVLHYKLALVLDNMGDREQAADHYRKALELDPNFEANHANLVRP